MTTATPTSDPAHQPLVPRGVSALLLAFAACQQAFRDITLNAAWRQERRDWHGLQADAAERLDVYTRVVRATVANLREMLGTDATSRTLWAGLKAGYAEAVGVRVDAELGETFFNSVVRRVFGTVGVDREIEFVDSADGRARSRSPTPAYDVHQRTDSVRALVTAILRGCWVANQRPRFNADLMAAEIEARWQATGAGASIDAIEVLRSVFYRNKGAYLIGRIRGGGRLLPLVIAFITDERGVVVDALLLSEDEASIVFSFTRSYFLVDVDAPWETITFLRSIMPAKRVAELYTSLGYNKHGKAELYRDLMRHLRQSSDQFEVAPGDRGMVMAVFTLPSYDIVFKVIRDEFDYPKMTNRHQVMRRYDLVFKHDRAGRLVDAQEYEDLAFPRHRFSETLLAELGQSAPSTVILDGDRVVIRHLYAERRVRPLNLYLREAEADDARAAVIDLGHAIKDMAATNIFPGDILLKNFGVTRHGRVIFYDYDEIGMLVDYRFRIMPEPRTLEEEMAAEPWFGVAPGDVFPEEFLRFMGLHGEHQEVFVETHGDLLTVDFWTRMQALHRSGEIVDIFPYQQYRRLPATGRSR